MTTEKVNILLVDDQPAKLLTYEAMLAQMGENLIKASSGREALEVLLKNDVTVVLMDVSMPELDGFELAQMIRNHPRHQQTAIIFVSAVAVTDLDRLKGYETGAVDYVSVPVIPELLRAKLSVFIELYRKRQEAERLNSELERRVADRTAELEVAMARQLELARELQAADRRKDEFLALLAHELRNPLAPVQNAVNIMGLKELADPDLKWCRDVIERQTRHLSRMVDDLLDVSRITHGKITLRLETLDLAAIVRAAVETSRPTIDAQHHKLRITLPDGPIWVQGDAARLTQVFANLLNNAATYQRAGGRIELSIDAREWMAEIRVRDHGIGIEPELLSEIFQLFAQGDRTLDRPYGGLGIGLSLVKNLVELHGGSVHASSEGPDKGAEFIVRLPCTESPEKQGRTGHGNGAKAKSRRILVVDDNRDAADSLARLLRLNGHAVQVAHAGTDALALADVQTPEVILLDLGLPGMDGYEICRRLRQHGHREMQIIAMTGYGQDRDRQLSEDAGFDLHTVKPVDITDLQKLMDRR
jgi:signal transduction histidine kinase